MLARPRLWPDVSMPRYSTKPAGTSPARAAATSDHNDNNKDENVNLRESVSMMR